MGRELGDDKGRCRRCGNGWAVGKADRNANRRQSTAWRGSINKTNKEITQQIAGYLTEAARPGAIFRAIFLRWAHAAAMRARFPAFGGVVEERRP